MQCFILHKSNLCIFLSLLLNNFFLKWLFTVGNDRLPTSPLWRNEPPFNISQNFLLLVNRLQLLSLSSGWFFPLRPPSSRPFTVFFKNNRWCVLFPATQIPPKVFYPPPLPSITWWFIQILSHPPSSFSGVEINMGEPLSPPFLVFCTHPLHPHPRVFLSFLTHRGCCPPPPLATSSIV